MDFPRQKMKKKIKNLRKNKRKKKFSKKSAVDTYLCDNDLNI